MTTTVLDRTEQTQTSDGDGPLTHIVHVPEDAGMTAVAYVLHARVSGQPVTALCGHRWYPERDPKKYPICPACMEIYETQDASSEGIPDA